MKTALALSAILLATPLLASEDHDAVRDALQRNEIIPLSEIISNLQKEFRAKLLEADFEQEDEIFIYELEMITRSGRIIDIVVDAATGEILEVEQERRRKKDK